MPSSEQHLTCTVKDQDMRHILATKPDLLHDRDHVVSRATANAANSSTPAENVTPAAS